MAGVDLNLLVAFDVLAALAERQLDAAGVPRNVAVVSESMVLAQETATAVSVGGPPDQLADGLARYRDAGADTLIAVSICPDPLDAAGSLGRARALQGPSRSETGA